jgi:hypothetical protein
MAARTEKIRQDIPDMISTTEQQGQRAGASMRGQVSWERKSGTRQLEKTIQIIVQLGQEKEDRMARI